MRPLECGHLRTITQPLIAPGQVLHQTTDASLLPIHNLVSDFGKLSNNFTSAKPFTADMSKNRAAAHLTDLIVLDFFKAIQLPY